MLKSPSEYYLKYLVSHQALTVDDILNRAEREDIDYIPGGSVYVIGLRDGLPFPRNFDPLNPRHRPSMDFLMQEKIYDMWYPSEATHQATSLYDSPPTREMICALLSTPMRIDKILIYLDKRMSVEVSGRALVEFRHYFWNIELLSEGGRRSILSSKKASTLIKTAVSTYKDAMGPLLILYKLGHLPPRLKKADILYAIRDISFMNGLDVDRCLPQGGKKATALRNYFELVLATQDKLDETESEESGVLSDFYQEMTVGKEEFNPPTRDALQLKEVNDEENGKPGSSEPDSN